MDYFLLNATTGELHTARPLDRELLPDATGIITLGVRVRVCLDCKPIGFILPIVSIRIHFPLGERAYRWAARK